MRGKRRGAWRRGEVFVCAYALGCRVMRGFVSMCMCMGEMSGFVGDVGHRGRRLARLLVGAWGKLFPTTYGCINPVAMHSWFWAASGSSELCAHVV